MKVLHVIPSVGPFRGGPSFALRTMASGLVRAGVEVHVVTTDDNGPERLKVPLGQPIIEDGVTFFYFKCQTQDLYTISWALARWLRRHIRDYDLIHIHSLFSFSSNIAGMYARRFRIPYIVRTLGHLNLWAMTRRRPKIKALSLWLLEGRLLRGAARLHFTSDREKQQTAHFGVELPCFILPLGIHTQPLGEVDYEPLLARFPLLRNRFVVLFLSRLHPIKGLDLLLPAFAALRQKNPDAVLVLAGDGDANFMQQLHEQIEVLGLNDVVIETGFMSGDDKARAFRLADVFVLPSYSENFGNAPVEAMEMGVPVIVSDQVGVAQIIKNANAGLVVACQVAELQQALEQLANDAQLRQTLGAAGRQTVEETLTIAATTRALIAQYQEVLRPKTIL